MSALPQYLLSVTGAAMLCGVTVRLLPKQGTAAAIGRMLAGVFLALTIMGPLGKLQIGDIQDWSQDLQDQAAQAVAQGQSQSRASLEALIKERTAAYILDKARNLGLSLSVTVEVSGQELPVPVRVHLVGSAGPYARARLQAIMEEDLGIKKEQQLWN